VSSEGARAASVPYRFGPFVEAPARRLLLRAGREVPRYLDLLLLLVARRNEAVSPRLIFDSVWSDVVVSDGALSQAVRTLRRALGERPARAALHPHGRASRLSLRVRRRRRGGGISRGNKQRREQTLEGDEQEEERSQRHRSELPGRVQTAKTRTRPGRARMKVARNGNVARRFCDER